MAEVLASISEGIGTVMFNRPEKRNCMNTNVMQEILRIFEEFDKDPEVKVIILTGSGEKAFCAGQDLGDFSGSAVEIREYVTEYPTILRKMTEMSKPIIGAINGYALAGGFGLAAACDIVLAADNAKFGVTEVNVGLYGFVIISPIVRTIGMKHLMELYYTGKHITAEEAKEIGLVNHVYPKEEFRNKVMEFVKPITEKSPLALKLGRQTYYNARDMEYHQAIKYCREMFPVLASSEDGREGVDAFLNKRKPVWKNR